ncbi:MAG: tRNA adenosine(34) deaminase TadA [Oscillospiraceae bacterium]|nr:tRNA adenosine(34) deaminase TadA [Oscillospiraceae bacterium]
MAHRDFMLRAVELAQKAYDMGEVPVGAVVVKDNKIIGEGYNYRETAQTALGHAEIMAIEAACRTLGSWRLEGCTLYVTMEPCIMCTGAIINSRIERVVYSLIDFKAGGLGGITDLNSIGLNHSVDTIMGVCEMESARLVDRFFKELREKKKK